MSGNLVAPSTATATRRPRARNLSVRRRDAARRRRAVLALAVLLVAVVATALALPVARRAISEFGLPLQYQDVIRQQAAEKHLDPALIAAVIYAETKFDPRPSSAGAQGLMQILPGTAQYLAHRSGARTFTTADLATPRVNIAYGTYYLRYLLDQYHGSLVSALAAYNGGAGNVNRWIARARARQDRFTISAIPFPETRDYVLRVLQARSAYRRTYPTQLGYR
ncbi:MAG: lytic transglycosylase domain-containing protein [Actinomycetota bacterium]|nr:lytic transglycosylase domain-containing protein [Actinomycetota bacterium]